MTQAHWLFDWHIRQRILPALAQLDGLQSEWPRALQVYDTLAQQNLAFDLRRQPPWPSNLCEDNSALELGYTFGGRDSCGLRYSFEPTMRAGILRNRYSLFRERMVALAQLLGPDYDLSALIQAAHIAVPREQTRQAETTVCIAAVHHYRDRPPRIKGYYSCDYPQQPRRGRQVAMRLLSLANDKIIEAQTREFFRQFRPQGGLRMVGLDVEPGKALAVKIYKSGDDLSKPALQRLIAMAGGGQKARAALQKFQDIFLDSARQPALFDLVTLATKHRGDPGLKLYIRPVDFYSDAEALRRLQAWYQWLGREDNFAQVRRGLSCVAPLEHLRHTRGFFNYISVDMGAAGASKTSVYFTPQILLNYLATKAKQNFIKLAKPVVIDSSTLLSDADAK